MPSKQKDAGQFMSFEADSSSCFGPCIPRATRIGNDGNVTLIVTGVTGDGVRPVCPPSPKYRVPEDELEKLKRMAMAIDLPKMKANYPSVYIDDVSMTTTVVVGKHTYRINHPSELPKSPDSTSHSADVSSLIALNREIERVGKTSEWLARCRLPSTRAPAPSASP